MIARQLIKTHGESYLKDLVNTPRNYLVPADITRSLQTFTVPDVLSHFGGKQYKDAIPTLDQAITENGQGDGFTNAVNQFKQVWECKLLLPNCYI